jgi:hypothetical protein
VSEPGTPFACNLSALTPPERTEHRALGARMLEAVLNRHELENGYRFELDRRRVSMDDLARWVELERECCPFFVFGLDPGQQDGPLALTLTGEPGIKDFIQAELPQAFR